MFSERLGTLEENELWQVLSRKRAAGDDVFDLTESNPTHVGLTYPNDEILAALAQPETLTYEPKPKGHLIARQAVARYYVERGKDVSPDDIVLTAGTSEAYSFLFKLLCEPGDEVLVPPAQLSSLRHTRFTRGGQVRPLLARSRSGRLAFTPVPRHRSRPSEQPDWLVRLGMKQQNVC